MYDLGELLGMHSGCFCCSSSSNVWFWKEQGLVSFAENQFQKCKHLALRSQDLPPYLPVVPHKAVAEVSKIGNL
jgi:hypothetical protein